jgi:putative hemolysin
MEDILEEIVGNIEDEHDDETKNMIQQASDGSYRMDGMTSLADVIDVLHIPVDEDSFETLSGFLISFLGKIPMDGQSATINAYGYRFEILRVENKMIRDVKVYQLAPENV